MKHPLNAIPLAVAAMAISLPAAAALEPVTQTYVAIAQSAYEDSLISARKLHQAIGALTVTDGSALGLFDGMESLTGAMPGRVSRWRAGA